MRNYVHGYLSFILFYIVISEWLVALCITLILATAIYISNRWKIYQLSWSLSGPFALPILGNALTFYCDDEELFDRATELCARYSSPLRFWFGPKFAIVFTDVLQAEKIMSSTKFINKEEVYRFVAAFDGEGLITASGAKWKRDRRLMSPIFLKRNAMQYFPYILHHTNILVTILQKQIDKPTFNIEPFVHRCVADFVNETIIGEKTNAQFGEMDTFLKTIKRMYTIVHARIVKVWLQIDWIFRYTSYGKEQEDGKKVIHGFLQRVLQNAKEKHTCVGIHDQNFRTVLDQLLDISTEVPHFATEEEMVHHLTTLYSASEDTVNTIVSFTLVLLGMYPNIQNKVAEEILNTIGKRSIEQDDLTRLEYLDMVIKDVLRLFPIAPFIIREASEDYQLEEWLIPKGCSVIVSIQNIHRDSKHWERPNEFYPEHFLPEAVRKRHPYAFMPFSAGPRGCIGKPYAYMSLKIMVVTILQQYMLESDGILQDKKLKMDISVRFRDDCYPVRIKKRL